MYNQLCDIKLVKLSCIFIIAVIFIIGGCSKTEKDKTQTSADTMNMSKRKTDTGMSSMQNKTKDTSKSVPNMKLTCVLSGSKDSKIKGLLTFTMEGKKVKMIGTIDGLTPGKHGIHIHENGDCSAPDFSSAVNHFNPNNGTHGDLNEKNSHMGDFGNILADKNGHATVDESSEYVDLSLILGKSIIVHANEDDLKTQPSGNSGPRIACGVIEKAK
jgi:Cu-Zn family superoxide dismutase